MKKIVKLNNPLILILCSVFIIVSTLLFSKRILVSNASTQTDQSETVKMVQNENPIDINDVLIKNTSDVILQEMLIEEIDLEYTTEYKNNPNLPKGTMQVLQEGRDGKQNIIIIKKYKDGEIISEEVVSENLVKASINKIVEVGSGNGSNTYIPKVGDVVYVTSNLLSVRLNPDNDSEKVCTLRKGMDVKIKEIHGDWFYILSEENNGYIAKDCVTNINTSEAQLDETIGDEFSKSTLTANLNFNMNLAKPSKLSLNQFKKIFDGQVADKNSVFKENAEYFYYAEKQYGINGVFLAAVGIHESAWGTSKISKDKKNLFGYGAVDSNPYGGAYSFNTYAEGIDLLARVFIKYYLNPKGTLIYDGNVANGKFYNGNTLSSVNIKYASDKNWANSVYKWMNHLYKSL